MKLPNGSVIPHGLLAQDMASKVASFNKSYQNFSLKAGIVVRSYDTSDKNNVTKLGPEYDVVVIEQDSNRGSTPVTYKNCLGADALGSIADYFEKRYRHQSKYEKHNGKNPKDQDGAIVMLLCLDGSADKAIVIGALSHPKRKSKLTGKGAQLAGEYNGIEISIKEDGSANLTFKGATDNAGKPKDAAQGNTTVDIEKDGSVQIKNKGVTQRLQKDGKYSLTTQDSVTVTAKKEITATTDDNLTIKVKKDSSLDTVKLAIKASGSCTMSVASFDLKSEGEASIKAEMYKVDAGSMIELKAGSQFSIEAGSMVQIKGSTIVLDGQVALGGAGGMPAVTMNTQFLGVGNLGIPVISQAIGPFSSKVTLL